MVFVRGIKDGALCAALGRRAQVCEMLACAVLTVCHMGVARELVVVARFFEAQDLRSVYVHSKAAISKIGRGEGVRKECGRVARVEKGDRLLAPNLGSSLSQGVPM